MYLTQATYEDLVVMKDLIESGQVAPVIDRTFPMSDFLEAFRYIETGHARGKVVINIL